MYTTVVRLIAFILCSASLACNAVATADDAGAVPDSAWDAAFTRTSGWTGGDVAGTADLGDGRTLWVFGDSWIGPVADGKHQPGSKMVNNAIAVSPNPRDPAKPPAAGDMKFYWGGTKDAPAAWVVPDVERVPPRGLPQNSGEPKNKKPDEQKTWYWPTGGAAVVPGQLVPGKAVPGPNDKPRLVVFLFHVARDAKPKSGVWNFRMAGGAMAVVDDFQGDPSTWRIVQHDVPHTVVPDGETKPTNWGMAVHVDADARPAMAYIYGTRAKPFDGELLLARVPAAQLTEMDRWEFFAGEGKWSPKSLDAAPITTRIPSEFSVERMNVAGRPTLVLVHSEVALGKRIFLRTAERPEGPWSKPRAVYTVPDVERHKSYFTYAAKGHSHLSRPGEILVTYLVNGSDFGAVFRDAYVYRPRFIRVPL